MCGCIMNIDELKALVAQKESHVLEFKKSTAQLKSAVESICAFLNESGGTVLIGVTDGGHMVGQEVTDNTRREIAHEISKIEPTIQVTVEYVLLDNGKQVIALKVPNGLYKPYVYDARPFQRNQSTTVKMSQHRYEQLLVKRGQLNYAWDTYPATDCKIADLDHDEIRRTVLQGIQVNRISADAVNEEVIGILKRLRLYKDNRLTNAAMVLFAKDVRDHYSQCHIKMARFKGTSKTGDFIDNQSFYGNAFKILSEASAFVQRHLPISSSYQEGKLERIDKPAIPPLAVREGLINAICHRDYSNYSASLSLAIFDDRLEIWNVGGLPQELTISDLKKTHESYPRNKLIADTFYNRGLIERWGTGTIKMIDSCKDQDVPLPEFEEYSGGLAVIFKYKGFVDLGMSDAETIERLNNRQRELLNLLVREGPLKPRDILNRLKLSVSERTLRYDLLALRKLGILDKRGHANTTLWFVRS